jgi:dTDP-4-amino-4,6-dideoxygalactose transaminase
MKIDWPHEFPGAYWLGEEEEEAVLDVLKNGSMFRYYGLKQPSYVDKLEESAKRFYGVKYALGINSGTGALICSMMAMGIGPGCEVIIPSFMWVATVGAVVQCGAIPVLCEINETFNLNPIDLEKKITNKTKLILPVHMAGAPCEMDKIMEIADRHGIPVLEDCAQCNGGSFRGKKVGTFGEMGIFSLQLNKNITSGEGGIIITDDEKLYARAFTAHDMGLIRVKGRLVEPEEDAIMWGGGRRMNEMCGAVANVQLSKLSDITRRMRSSKKRIKEMIKNVKGLKFRRLADEEGDSGPFLIIILEDENMALSAAEKMKKNGIHSIHRIADYGLHIYYNISALVNKTPLSPNGNPWSLCVNKDSDYNYSKGACPQSDKLFRRSILIPIPSCLTGEQEKKAAEIIRDSIQ